MGSVYEALDHKLASTPCAVKEVLSEALEGPDADYVLKSFDSEMRALASLDHPHIPRIRDYFEDAGRRYLVLDLVQGIGLDDELRRHLQITGQPMEAEVAALDMISVLETLSYLHSRTPAIVHRDIKPANLIRERESGRIKLVDFGIARSVESVAPQTQVGTPGFSAPEQMAGKAEPRSDLYSVGATLYFLCTARLPSAHGIRLEDSDLPDQPGLRAIIQQATRVRPSERYPNAEAMAEALRSWLRKEGSTKIVPSQIPPAIQAIHPLARPEPSSNSHNLYYWLLILLILPILWLFPWPGQDGPSPTPTPKVSGRP